MEALTAQTQIRIKFLKNFIMLSHKKILHNSHLFAWPHSYFTINIFFKNKTPPLLYFIWITEIYINNCPKFEHLEGKWERRKSEKGLRSCSISFFDGKCLPRRTVFKDEKRNTQNVFKPSTPISFFPFFHSNLTTDFFFAQRLPI